MKCEEYLKVRRILGSWKNTHQDDEYSTVRRILGSEKNIWLCVKNTFSEKVRRLQAGTMWKCGEGGSLFWMVFILAHGEIHSVL